MRIELRADIAPVALLKVKTECKSDRALVPSLNAVFKHIPRGHRPIVGPTIPIVPEREGVPCHALGEDRVVALVTGIRRRQPDVALGPRRICIRVEAKGDRQLDAP